MIRTRARACDGKIRHEYKAQALGQWAGLAHAGARYNQLQVYKCPYCAGWHVGHRSGKRR